MNTALPSDSANRSHKLKEFCKLCGIAIGAKQNYQNPCPICLKNEPSDLLKRFDEIDRKALKQELDIDSTLKDYIFIQDAATIFGDKWIGYKVQYLGVIVGKYSEFDWESYENNLNNLRDNSDDLKGKNPKREVYLDYLISLKNTPSKLMPFPCIPIKENPDLIFMLCRMRIFYQDDIFYSEMKLHSFGVKRISIQGLEKSKTKRDLERAWNGLELLRKIERDFGGRPKGSTIFTANEFRKAVLQTFVDYFEMQNEEPRAVYIAETMGISIETFYRRMKEIKWNMKILREKAKKKVKRVIDSY